MKRTTFKREPCSILKDKDDVLQQIKDGYLYMIGDSEFQKSMTLDKQDQLIMSVHDALSLMLAFGGFLLALLTITTTRSKDTKKPPKL